MNDVRRAIDFCASLDPGFPTRIRGASAEEIATLEQAMGGPLLEAHRQFIETMGEDMGGLFLGLVDTSARTLSGAVGRIAGARPDGLEVFGVATGESDEDLFMRQHGDAVHILRHFWLYGGRWAHFDLARAQLVASSLAELLCSAALREWRMRKMPVRRAYGRPHHEADDLERFARRAEGQGLERLWFSTSTTVAVRREDIDVIAALRPGIPLSVEIAGARADAVADLVRGLGLEGDLTPIEL